MTVSFESPILCLIIGLIALGVIAFAVIALYAVPEWELRAQREAGEARLDVGDVARRPEGLAR